MSTVLSDLPTTFPAAITICLHRRVIGLVDGLPELLARRTALPVRPLMEGEPLPSGEVVVPPPGTALSRSSRGGWVAEAVDEHPVDHSLVSLA